MGWLNFVEGNLSDSRAFLPLQPFLSWLGPLSNLGSHVLFLAFYDLHSMSSSGCAHLALPKLILCCNWYELSFVLEKLIYNPSWGHHIRTRPFTVTQLNGLCQNIVFPWGYPLFIVWPMQVIRINIWISIPSLVQTSTSIKLGLRPLVLCFQSCLTDIVQFFYYTTCFTHQPPLFTKFPLVFFLGWLNLLPRPDWCIVSLLLLRQFLTLSSCMATSLLIATFKSQKANSFLPNSIAAIVS